MLSLGDTLLIELWSVLLRLSAELHDTGDIQAIEVTGMDRIVEVQHYAKRTKYMFKAVKTTTLIDCQISRIIDIN